MSELRTRIDEAFRQAALGVGVSEDLYDLLWGPDLIAGRLRFEQRFRDRWQRRAEHELRPWEDVCLQSGLESAEEA